MSKKTTVVSFLLGFLVSGIVFLSIGYISLNQSSQFSSDYSALIRLKENLTLLELSGGNLRCTLLSKTLGETQRLSKVKFKEPLMYSWIGANLSDLANTHTEKALQKVEEVNLEELVSRCVEDLK